MIKYVITFCICIWGGEQETYVTFENDYDAYDMYQALEGNPCLRIDTIEWWDMASDTLYVPDFGGAKPNIR